jgi:hypothetical protein
LTVYKRIEEIDNRKTSTSETLSFCREAGLSDGEASPVPKT